MNPDAEDFFKKGCGIIECHRDASEAEGKDVSPEVLEGYRLLKLAYDSGIKEAPSRSVDYFKEGCFPVFSESTTLEIVLILADYGFDEALFLAGHYLEFGTDGNPPGEPGMSEGYYRRALEAGYRSAVVSLARRLVIRGGNAEAEALYQRAVDEDLRERREAVLSLAYLLNYGLSKDGKDLTKVRILLSQMGDALADLAFGYFSGHPENPDLIDYLKTCRIPFSIGEIWSF